MRTGLEQRLQLKLPQPWLLLPSSLEALITSTLVVSSIKPKWYFFCFCSFSLSFRNHVRRQPWPLRSLLDDNFFFFLNDNMRKKKLKLFFDLFFSFTCICSFSSLLHYLMEATMEHAPSIAPTRAIM